MLSLHVESCSSVYPYWFKTIPRAWMGYHDESMAHWLRGYEGERNNCFRKIQLVGQKNIETNLSEVKARHQSFLPPKHYKYGGRFSLLVGYNM